MRRTYNLFGVVLCLAAASCTSLPQTFTRVDGRKLVPNQLSTDEAICRGEVKDNLSADNQTTTRGPTEDAMAIYTGCMARRGYRTAE